MSVQLIDAHCHLEAKSFPDVEETLARAAAAGVGQVVAIGQFHAPGDYGQALALTERYANVAATMGVHPHEVERTTAVDWSAMEQMWASAKVKAIGETGLDYYYEHSPRALQAEGFERHIAAAKRLNKPLIIHVRDAHPDAMSMLKSAQGVQGVIHCFTGSWEEAKVYLDLGLHLSIAGIVTYKKTEALREAVQKMPLDRLMVETDSPYLAPIPLRGQRNEPMNVVHTAKCIAELRGESFESLAAATYATTQSFFGLVSAAG